MTAIVLFIVGVVIGSFLNVVVYRMPRGRSIVRPPSACPSCDARVRPWDNVPILSYLILRGKCRSCGARIPPRYLVVEVLSGAIPVLLYYVFGTGREFFIYWPLAYALLVITFIDLDLKIIPDRITLPGIVVGLIAAPLVGVTTLPESLLGVAVGGGALYGIGILGAITFKKESMGGGDVKLAAMLGAFLGWKAALILLFVAFLMGAVVGVAAIARKGRDWDHIIPFGPFMASGAFLTMVWGESVLRWYTTLLG
jgi:leader peptidase (prepilin peptidase)/N-methyltransferase